MREEPWDYPPRRGRPRPQVEEYLPPEQPEPRLHVYVRHRHSWITPQLVTIAAVIVAVMILIRNPMALLMLGVLVPRDLLVALGVMVIVVIVAALREHRRGRPF